MKRFLVFTVGIPVCCFGVLEVGARLLRDKTLRLERQGRMEETVSRDQTLFLLEVMDDHELPIEDWDEIDFYQRDRFLIWKLKPNIQLTTPNLFFPARVREQTRWTLSTNSRGFRGLEHPFERSEKYRILVLGDSNTFGWGVDDGKSHPDRLEHILNNRPGSSRYEVINISIPGYTSAQGVRLLRRHGLRYQPDLLIINFGRNDSVLVSPQNTDQAVFKRGASWLGTLQEALDQSQFYMLLRGLALRRIRRDERRADPATQTPRVPRSEYAQNLREMVHLTRKHGAEVFFIDTCVPAAYRPILEQVARELEITRINTEVLFSDALEIIKAGSGYLEESLYYEQRFGEEFIMEHPYTYTQLDGCHPSVFGHQLVAEAIAAKLHP